MCLWPLQLLMLRIEGIFAVQEVCLHPLVAMHHDGTMLLAALSQLSQRQAVLLLRYLLQWMRHHTGILLCTYCMFTLEDPMVHVILARKYWGKLVWPLKGLAWYLQPTVLLVRMTPLQLAQHTERVLGLQWLAFDSACKASDPSLSVHVDISIRLPALLKPSQLIMRTRRQILQLVNLAGSMTAGDGYLY